MLGLLGTFIGMMIALQGAVGALEGSTELAAIRAGLTAPIKGLSMAFGTSVGGVAASAVLGLLSAMARRQRLAVVRELDVQGARLFPGQGPLHYRQQMLHEARTQTGQLPLLLAQVEALVTRVDSATDSLHTRMLEGQEDLQNKLVTLHTGLFEHVGQSLRESFAASGREAGESMAPILRDTMQAIAAHGEMTMGDLANEVSLSQATVTTILDRLEKRELLGRKRGEQDKRRVYAHLTSAGLDIIEKAPTPLQDEFIERFDRLEDWDCLLYTSPSPRD